MSKSCREDQDCFPPYGSIVTVGAWCSNETGQCERCPDNCFPHSVHSWDIGELATYPIGIVPGNLDSDEMISCPSPCCDFGMNGNEYDADGDSYYNFPGRIKVLPCRSEWKDIKMMVLEGVHPEASPEDFAVNGTSCDQNPRIDRNHESGNILYDLDCRFIDPCTTAEFSVALLGTDQEGKLRFVNETVYPVTGTFTTGRCSKECETDQDCIEDWRGVKEGSWCGVARCARCPRNCLPSSQRDIHLPLGAGLEEEGDCPSPRCCDFGMDGNEVQNARGGWSTYVHFNVLPCDPAYWQDIEVYVLRGKELDARPEAFVKKGFKCRPTPPEEQENSLHPSEIEIYCSGFMDPCKVQTHTFAMIGKDSDGNRRFVNETAYPISREFDSNEDGCQLDDIFRAFALLAAAGALILGCIVWCCCRGLRQRTTRNTAIDGRSVAAVAQTTVTSDDIQTTEAKDNVSSPSRPQESPISNQGLESDSSASA